MEGIVFKSSISNLPWNLVTTLDSDAILDAVPPKWKVLSVSCVPGSPIDCAATTPTVSPGTAIFAVDKFLP